MGCWVSCLATLSFILLGAAVVILELPWLWSLLLILGCSFIEKTRKEANVCKIGNFHRRYSGAGKYIYKEKYMEKNLLSIMFLFSLLFFSLISSIYAQEEQAKPKKQFPLEFSFFNHASSSPFDSTILDILHPGFSLGTEFTYKEGRFSKFYQGLSLGYFYHEIIAKGLFLQTTGGYRYTTGLGFFGDLTVGLGYLLYFHPGQVFKLNDQGEYEPAKSPGKSALMISFSLGVGYDFSRKAKLPLSIFIRYQPFGQTPYSNKESWWLHAMLHVGIRVQLW